MKFLLIFALLFNPLVVYSKSLQCAQLFGFQMSQVLPMSAKYVGEHEGRYIDPLTKKPWNVKYFTREERQQFFLHAVGGKLVNFKNEPVSSEFDPESITFEKGLVVLTKKYELYLMPYEQRGRFHHSSLSSGKDVLFAGEMSLHRGQVRDVSDRSGHYKPNPQALVEFIHYLEYLGLDLRNMKVSGHAVELMKRYSLSYNEWKNLTEQQ